MSAKTCIVAIRTGHYGDSLQELQVYEAVLIRELGDWMRTTRHVILTAPVFGKEWDSIKRVWRITCSVIVQGNLISPFGDGL